MRVEMDVGSGSVTTFECRPPWREDFGPAWTRFPIARFRYVRVRKEWSIYWRDRNLKFHPYDRIAPTPNVETLLDEITADPTSISGVEVVSSHDSHNHSKCVAVDCSSRHHLGVPEIIVRLMMSESTSAPRYPTADEQASWAAIGAALDELVAAFQRRDAEGMMSAGSRMLAVEVDWDAYLNAVRAPRDADELSRDLEAILLRIPDGWGRWIRVGSGWYQIIVALDRKLAALYPDYRVLQVKEKFGGLRYYWRPGDAEWSGSPAERGNQLVEAAAALAARTCEECGLAGTLMERRGWLRTLCEGCARAFGCSASVIEDEG